MGGCLSAILNQFADRGTLIGSTRTKRKGFRGRVRSGNTANFLPSPRIAVDQNSKDEKRTEDQVQWPSTDRKRSSLSNDVQHRGEDNLTRARIGSVKKTYKIYNQCN